MAKTAADKRAEVAAATARLERQAAAVALGESVKDALTAPPAVPESGAETQEDAARIPVALRTDAEHKIVNDAAADAAVRVGEIKIVVVDGSAGDTAPPAAPPAVPDEAAVREVIALAERRAELSGKIATLNNAADGILTRMTDRTLDRDARLSAMAEHDSVSADLETEIRNAAETDAQIAARREVLDAALSGMRDAIGTAAAAFVADVSAVVADGAASVDAAALGTAVAGMIGRARHFNSLCALTGMDGMKIGSVVASPFSKRSGGNGSGSGSGSGSVSGTGKTTITELADGACSFVLSPAAWGHIGEYLPDTAFTVTTYGGKKDARRYRLNAAQRADAIGKLKIAGEVTRDDQKLETIKRWAERLRADSGAADSGAETSPAEVTSGAESGAETDSGK